MTERQMAILRELNEFRGGQNSFCTLLTLAQKLNVSQRTVSTDLAEIKTWLQSFDGLAQLESKRGIGVRLVTDDRTWEMICSRGGMPERGGTTEVSVNHRIIRKILMEKRVRCADIQEQFFLSKSQMKAALVNVECFLGAIGIPMQIRSGSGIHIYCDKAQWRDALWHLFLGMEAEMQAAPDWDGGSGDRVQRLISLLLPGVESEKIGSVLAKLEADFHIFFTSESRKKIMLYAAMAIAGCPKDREDTKPLTAKETERIGNRTERQMAQYMTDALGVAYRRRLDAEREQFVLLFELAEWIPGYGSTGRMPAEPELQALTAQMIEWFSGCMRTDCSADERLRQALLFYLRPMLHHLEYGLSMPVLFGNEIIRRHTFIYMMCLSQKQTLERLVGCELQGNELIGLTQIFGNAWLRVVHTVKASLVCDLNYAAGQGVRDQVERMVPDILIEGAMTTAQRRQIASYKGDLLILCGVEGPIPYSGTTVRISAFLQKADVVKLQRACEKIRRGEAGSLYALDAQPDSAVRLFDRRAILTDYTAKTKEEVLERLCRMLKDCGYVTDDFFSTVIGRELQETTEIGNGFAMPHGYASAVKKPSVAVALLKRPILWSENTYVDKIFLIAVDINEKAYNTKIHDFYHALSLLTDSSEQCMRLMDMHNANELEIFLNNL